MLSRHGQRHLRICVRGVSFPPHRVLLFHRWLEFSSIGSEGLLPEDWVPLVCRMTQSGRDRCVSSPHVAKLYHTKYFADWRNKNAGFLSKKCTTTCVGFVPNQLDQCDLPISGVRVFQGPARTLSLVMSVHFRTGSTSRMVCKETIQNLRL